MDIQPIPIGTPVLYRPHHSAGADVRSYAAMVTFVWGPDVVNVAWFDATGGPYHETSVPLLGVGDLSPIEGNYVELVSSATAESRPAQPSIAIGDLVTVGGMNYPKLIVDRKLSTGRFECLWWYNEEGTFRRDVFDAASLKSYPERTSLEKCIKLEAPSICITGNVQVSGDIVPMPDCIRWAEGLIRQLPADHDGRNSWLLNYGSQNVQEGAASVEVKTEALAAGAQSPSLFGVVERTADALGDARSECLASTTWTRHIRSDGTTLNALEVEPELPWWGTFGDAIKHLKKGGRVSRQGWADRSRTPMITPDDTWLAYSPAYAQLSAEKFWAGPNRKYAESLPSGAANVAASITQKLPSGDIVMGWAPSQQDMLAEDWVTL